MVDSPGTGAMSRQVLIGAIRQQVTTVQATPEMKVRMEESDRRAAYAQAVDKEYRDAWSKKTSGSSGMQLGDVSTQSPQMAAGNLAAMEKLRDSYGENGLQISASRGEETTTSLNTYITWLQERAGAASANELTQGSLFSLKV